VTQLADDLQMMGKWNARAAAFACIAAVADALIAFGGCIPSGFTFAPIGGIMGDCPHVLKRSPSLKCAHPACAGSSSTARTIVAAITLPSAATDGPTMCGCLILSPGSFCSACDKRGADVRPDFH
jgi:hypothetical protein